jgi:5-enolpyruvylshikimate-3-phosphate synthase
MIHVTRSISWQFEGDEGEGVNRWCVRLECGGVESGIVIRLLRSIAAVHRQEHWQLRGDGEA